MNFVKSKNVYEEHGQFEYPHRSEEFTESIQEYVWDKTKQFQFVYTGQFKHGTEVFDGTGMIIFNNGAIFEGYFKDNKKNGPGRYIWSTGSYYIGDWRDGKREGYGELIKPNGDIYKGYWRDNKRDGSGEEYFADGSEFRGSFTNDKRHGKGELYYIDPKNRKGKWIKGLWKEGEAVQIKKPC